MWSAATAVVLLLVQTPDYSSEARKALDEQKYDVAAELLTKAVAANPKDYATQFNLALTYSLLGKDDDAIAGYRKVLELEPGLYEAELNLGIVLLRQKRAPEAVPVLEDAAGKRPKLLRPQLYLADALLETGDLPKAEQAYQAAAGIDPKSAPADLGLGRALARQNKLADAEPHYRNAAALDAANKGALLELAEMYEKTGQPGQAISIYTEFPDNVAVRERLGQMLVEAGKPAEAIPHLLWAVTKSPTAANRLALAQAYRQNHEPDKELPLLEEALGAEPDNFDLRLAYGRELRDQKRFADAARQFSLVTKARPDSVPAWNELAAMLVSLEDYPQALAALDRVKALGAETAGHHYLRAMMFDKMKDLKRALASYEAFLTADQDKHADEDFKARQRVRILKREIEKR
jgi:tetratricopeptide (TPR) repeat protein